MWRSDTYFQTSATVVQMCSVESVTDDIKNVEGGIVQLLEKILQFVQPRTTPCSPQHSPQSSPQSSPASTDGVVYSISKSIARELKSEDSLRVLASLFSLAIKETSCDTESGAARSIDEILKNTLKDILLNYMVVLDLANSGFVDAFCAACFAAYAKTHQVSVGVADGQAARGRQVYYVRDNVEPCTIKDMEWDETGTPSMTVAIEGKERGVVGDHLLMLPVANYRSAFGKLADSIKGELLCLFVKHVTLVDVNVRPAADEEAHCTSNAASVLLASDLDIHGYTLFKLLMCQMNLSSSADDNFTQSFASTIANSTIAHLTRAWVMTDVTSPVMCRAFSMQMSVLRQCAQICHELHPSSVELPRETLSARILRILCGGSGTHLWNALVEAEDYNALWPDALCANEGQKDQLRLGWVLARVAFWGIMPVEAEEATKALQNEESHKRMLARLCLAMLTRNSMHLLSKHTESEQSLVAWYGNQRDDQGRYSIDIVCGAHKFGLATTHVMEKHVAENCEEEYPQDSKQVTPFNGRPTVKINTDSLSACFAAELLGVYYHADPNDLYRAHERVSLHVCGPVWRRDWDELLMATQTEIERRRTESAMLFSEELARSNKRIIARVTMNSALDFARRCTRASLDTMNVAVVLSLSSADVTVPILFAQWLFADRETRAAGDSPPDRLPHEVGRHTDALESTSRATHESVLTYRLLQGVDAAIASSVRMEDELNRIVAAAQEQEASSPTKPADPPTSATSTERAKLSAFELETRANARKEVEKGGGLSPQAPSADPSAKAHKLDPLQEALEELERSGALDALKELDIPDIPVLEQNEPTPQRVPVVPKTMREHTLANQMWVDGGLCDALQRDKAHQQTIDAVSTSVLRSIERCAKEVGSSNVRMISTAYCQEIGGGVCVVVFPSRSKKDASQ